MLILCSLIILAFNNINLLQLSHFKILVSMIIKYYLLLDDNPNIQNNFKLIIIIML